MIKRNKKPLGDGTAVWVDSVGGMSERVFKIVEKQSEEKVTIGFSPTEVYSINPKHIRSKRVIMFKTSSGKVISQNPDNWASVDLEKADIKTLRFNLQNFGLQESKAAQHRWTVPLTNMDKLIPLFKIMFICIAVGVIGWGGFKFATFLFTRITASSMMDCAQLIQKLPSPIGANITAPIGV